jgi:hypothetical protein
MVLVRMPDGIVFRVEGGICELARIWSWAMRGCQLLEIRNDAGKQWLLNPYQIIYLDGWSEPAKEAGGAARRAQPRWRRLLREAFLTTIPNELPVLSGWLEQDRGLAPVG